MQQAQETDKIEMSLREHLLAAGAGQSATPVTPVQPSHGVVHHDAHNIDPAIAGSAGYAAMSPGSADGDLSESRKGRRELSTSKRAAQNRAAQRAFRQRKEEYIKSLKDQVKQYEQLAETYKAVQNENYQLRDYIISLQSRLLDAQGTLPEPPANIDLTRRPVMPEAPQPHQLPPSPSSSHQPAPTATMTPVAINQLQQAAAQATAHEANHDLKAQSGYVPASEYPHSKEKDANMAGGSSTAGGDGSNGV